MSNSPSKNIASRYLDSLNNENITNPLQPTLKYNSSSPIKPGMKNSNPDLDVLAKQLNISSPTSSPNKTALLRERFESPSVTVSSFKSPSPFSSVGSDTTTSTSPIKRNGLTNTTANTTDLSPSWANKNYKENLKTSPSRYTNTTTPKRPVIGSLKPLIDPISTPDTRSRTSSPIFTSPSNNTSRDSAGYEYLCRIQAIKTWLIEILQEDIEQSPVELISYIRNGIHLAKLSNVILPNQRRVFLNDGNLQFKHTENINRFFTLLDYLNVPDLFRFELTDLYDGKNVPKVWFCLHALSYILNISDSNYPKIESVVDKVEFDPEDIRLANRALIGSPLPNFDSADNGKEDDNQAYINRVTTSTKVPIRFEPKVEPRVETPSPKMNLVDPFREEPVEEEVLVVEEVEEIEPVKFEPVEPVYRGSSQYYTPELESHTINIIKFQSLARGANFRYSMFVKKILLKSYQDEFTHLFSIIRGNKSRLKTVHKHRNTLRDYTFEITELQAIIRRKFVNSQKPEFNIRQVVKFQTDIRGQLVRNRTEHIKKTLQGELFNIITLQSRIRARAISQTTRKLIEVKTTSLSSIIQLQSAARKLLYQRNSNSNLIDADPIVSIQSIIRRGLLINKINHNHSIIRNNRRNLVELQSIARGGITRTRLCNNVLITLLFEDDNLNDLYAIIRGKNLRREVKHKKQQLKKYEYSILPIQTLFRSVLCRFTREIILDDVYQQVDSLIQVQSIIRGNLIRQDIRQLKQYYHQNVDLVIKSQAILRRAFVQGAYQELITCKTPSLTVIRKFAHLLSNSDFDYDEEIELSQAKDIIIEKSKRNEEIESQIDQLDIKLKLLDKNKITIEEFIKPSKSKTNSMNAINVKNLPRMNKGSKERIELYQTLFYFLQTRPNYLVKLYNNIPFEEKDSKFVKDLFGYIVQLFPITAKKSREEFFYMKWILTVMESDITKANNISDITKSQSSFWIDYFLQFNNSSSQRQHLKLILGKFVIRIIENDELEFESDPCLIHKSLIEHEIKIHGNTKRDYNLTPQAAIKLPEVSNKFIDNLLSLRETTTKLLDLLNSNIANIPSHVKVICNQAYQLSTSQFPNRTDQQHLAVAGVVFFKHYLGSIFHVPESYGITLNDPFNPKIQNKKARNNLLYVNRVMLQLFSMKPFSDNFLKPLNEYIINSIDTVRRLILEIINVKTIELEYGLNEYDDIVISQRPELTMKINTMISLEKIVSSNIDSMVPGTDDQLLRVINELDNLVNSSQDLMFLTDLGALTLNLNPETNEDSVVDAKIKTLFTQVKRCILYIIRIQPGDELLELLISGIQPSDEDKFKSIILAERKEAEESNLNEKKKPYYKSSLGDLSKITYHELKKMALSHILELESMKELSRRNSFQEILNQIAVDIKTKDTQRERRRQQLTIIKTTAIKLTEKEKFLAKQLEDYNKHIETVLYQLQTTPKDKKIFNIIPVFSKQYFYHRELRKRNRLPKFGSYKYSSKRLLDQKVVIDIGGLIMNRNYMKSSKLDFLFSCHKVGKFTIEAANGSVAIPGASGVLTLDEILTLQYENMNKIEMFDGSVIFDCANLVALLFKKFYDIRE
ncbi:Ras GTPase-activating-like protein IQG1 [Spathaspora sp. JA1]|nr:Ras GTPase-activating-like protein IQG1 [Spathaspora sp. JA1]